jgi:alpha-L-fucosidase
MEVTVRTTNQTLSGKLTPNGKMVVEPNENNYTDEFVNIPIGTIHVDQTGKQKITFQTKGNEQLLLNSLWIEKIK